MLVVCSFTSGLAGAWIGLRLQFSTNATGDVFNNQPVKVVDEQSAIVDVASKASPSVVSIVITKDLPKYYYYGYPGSSSDTQPTQVGAGSGFVVSSDGKILTNRHVVSDENASYTVTFNDGTQLPAKVLARDTVLDIAMIKVEAAKPLTPLPLGDSDKLKIGQTVVAIGNSLGEFSNTVSAGIISGLSRSITASDSGGSTSETLEQVIQTDAGINLGNSGGPLIDIDGNVIGVNVAIASNAQNISFAIPITPVKKIIESINKTGTIVRPYLGVRYTLVTPQVKADQKLSVDHGALVATGTASAPGVIKNGPADKAGIKEGDVITEVNDHRIDEKNSLQNEIQKYNVGDIVIVKYVRGTESHTVSVTLEKQ
jgi:serine protease Do